MEYPNIIFKKELKSTNDFLYQFYNEYDSGTIVYTHKQTNGKGLSNNKWESYDNQNITLSYLLKDKHVNAYRQFIVNMQVAMTITDFLERITQSNFEIKWPNDILYHKKKICGVLINNLLMGTDVKASIIGIGININQTEFQPHIPNPISLRQITGKKYDLENIVNLFMRKLFNDLENIEEQDVKNLKSRFLSKLFQMNVWSNYNIKGIQKYAKITGINDFGLLNLIDDEGNVYECDLKEVIYL